MVSERGRRPRTRSHRDSGTQVGPQGPAGGLAGVQYVMGPAKSLPANTTSDFMVNCPSGKAALSGGFWASGENPVLGVSASNPVVSQYGPDGWSVTLVNSSGTGHLVLPWVICATRGS